MDKRASSLAYTAMFLVIGLVLSPLAGHAAIDLTNCRPAQNYSFKIDAETAVQEFKNRIQVSQGDKTTFALYLQTMMNVLSEQRATFIQNETENSCRLETSSFSATQIFQDSMMILQTRQKELLGDVGIPEQLLNLRLQMQKNSIQEIDL